MTMLPSAFGLLGRFAGDLLTSALSWASSLLFGRVSRSLLPDHSFPSGHTMNAVVFDLALALVIWSIRGRGAGLVAMVVAIVIALVVGTSRIYLGYHDLTDVVGGLLAGIAVLLVVGEALRARPALRQWQGPGTTAPDGRPAAGTERSN